MEFSKDDYIKRDDAIRCIMEHKGITPIAKLEAETAICRIPATDVRENVHAHWIHRKNWGNRFVCSNCSMEMTDSQIGAFCKECGAIMDGDKQ